MASILVLLRLIIGPFLGAVQGTVLSSSDSEPVAYASVELVELDRGTQTDRSGRFLLTDVPEGEWTLRVTALGHVTEEEVVRVPGEGVVRVEVRVDPDPVRIPGITAVAARGADRAGPGALRIDMEAARVVPALAEPDLLRAAQVLPSVNAASDYSSALYIRGGAPDHTLVLLDGFPIFNPYHFGGVFGAFNPDAVEEVELLPGALPAALGGRLSSVVKVHTRDGRMGRHAGSGGFGLLSSRAAVDGPLPGNGGSYLISGRRSYLDMVGGGMRGDGIMPGSFSAGFHDLLFAANHQVGFNGSLSAVVFADGEWIGLPDTYSGAAQYDWDWGSRLVGLTLRKPLGLRTVSVARVGWTDFRTDLDSWWRVGSQGVRDPTVRAQGTMRDFLVGFDLERRTRSHELSMGVQGDFYLMDYDSWRAPDPPEGFFEDQVPQMERREEMGTVSAFVEDVWQVSDALHLRAGGRVLVGETGGARWAPRMGLRWDLSPQWSVSLGGGRYHQPLRSIRVEEAVGTNFMSYDLLLPIPDASDFQTSDDVVAGLAWQSGGLSVRLDGYVKKMRSLLVPPIPTDPRHAQVLEPEEFREGSGEVRGLELLGQYGSGLTGIWVSYALVEATTTVDGVEITPRYERRHALDVMSRLSLPDGIRITLRSLFSTGQPTTPPTGVSWPPVFDPTRGGFTNIRPGQTMLLGEHNSERTPAYWRIDLGARFSMEREILGQEVDLSPYAEIINLLNIGNVVFWEPSSPTRRADPFLQLPMTFTAGLEWSF